MDSTSFATQQIHAAQKADPTTRSITVPIYASTAFAFDDSQHLDAMITGKTSGFVYSRMSNPTCSIFEQRMAVLEGGVGAVSAATGQAAMLLAVLALGKAGDNFVVRPAIFGGTYQQWKVFLPRLGITAKFVPDSSPSSFASLIDENTKGIFLESVANPLLEVIDIAEVAKVAKASGVPLIVDNTAGGGGYLIRPIDLGADIVVHSATKWISGHGSAMGGVAISSGKFAFKGNPRFPEFNEELPGFPGMNLSEKGNQALLIKMRSQTLRDMGCSLSPFAAFQLLQGLETLSLRMDRHCSNALALAGYLGKQPEVAWVSYPGLPFHTSHEIAKRLMPRGFGAVVCFGLKPKGGFTGEQMALRCMDGCSMTYLAGNLGDVRTLMIHPASTTHRQVPRDVRRASGTADDLLRVSVGTEDIKDIIADFEKGIKAACS